MTLLFGQRKTQKILSDPEVVLEVVEKYCASCYGSPYNKPEGPGYLEVDEIIHWNKLTQLTELQVLEILCELVEQGKLVRGDRGEGVLKSFKTNHVET